MDNLKVKRWLHNFIAFFVSLSICIAIVWFAEMRLESKYGFVLAPTRTVSPSIVSFTGLFTHSHPPKKSDPRPWIICVGGSTTHGGYAAEESFPYILGELFSHNYQTSNSASVYNCGVSGVSSIATNFFIKKILFVYKPECIILHDGYNDLPIITKKISENKYSYETFDYSNSNGSYVNPYIRNPVVRYFAYMVKINLPGIYTYILRNINKGKPIPVAYGTDADIMEENQKRLKVMLGAEIDTIDQCLSKNIKVIVIIEPHMRPSFYLPEFGSAFKDVNAGSILDKCHRLQQAEFLSVLNQRYLGNNNVLILDLRRIFDDDYQKFHVDQIHLNARGNMILANILYKYLAR
ncbi:MAG: hypothetical protein MUF05_00035 [Candidatus Omnitrophica bacterium]|jgi:hypothetical protein|nr:hypothetical protein [Candidatus Omnitrophota bacterium]